MKAIVGQADRIRQLQIANIDALFACEKKMAEDTAEEAGSGGDDGGDEAAAEQGASAGRAAKCGMP